MIRSQTDRILKDLDKKMVFLSGPRQVGKSWLSRGLMERFGGSVYLNYDSPDDREILKSRSWPGGTPLLVLDEIHKMEGWKNWLKGVFDTRREGVRILVTGSARLDTFRQSGDSLAGRYFHHRLLPFDLKEARSAGSPLSLQHFIERGGFPEPLLAGDPDDAGRWRRQYLDGLIREDILNFENIRNLRSMNLLVELLRQRVGSPLSYTSLAEDIGASPNSVRQWISVLEALYIVFRIHPHTGNLARSLLQQPKLYFFDTGLVTGDNGVRFENHVAVTLLKEILLREDRDGKVRRLGYLRTKEGREVDFALVEEDKTVLMVEAKWSDRAMSPSLQWLRDKIGCPAIQLVADLDQERDVGPVLIRKAGDWLTTGLS
jgi:predicted AAA+ superfamily ATPase